MEKQVNSFQFILNQTTNIFSIFTKLICTTSKMFSLKRIMRLAVTNIASALKPVVGHLEQNVDISLEESCILKNSYFLISSQR